MNNGAKKKPDELKRAKAEGFKVGDLVDYHSVVGGEITTYGHEIKTLLYLHGTPIAWITNKTGFIILSALTRTRTTVINIKDNPNWQAEGAIYIGRASQKRGLEESLFHNPFKNKPRAELIKLHKEYFLERLETDQEFLSEALKLRNKVLACYCTPLPCHGDTIAAFLNK